MLQLVYVSRACVGLDAADLKTLAEQSASRNLAAGITGLLLFDTYRFMQALEGSEPAIRATMTRIESDQRHDNIIYLRERSIEQRQFGDWSMNYKVVPRGSAASEFVLQAKADVELVDDPSLRAAFIGFAILGVRR